MFWFNNIFSTEPIVCLFLPLGRLGGFEAHYPTRHLAPHLQAHEDMHERRPSKEAQIWHDCANSGKNARQVKNLLCPPLLNRRITGYLIADITLIWWCGAYQYCLKLLLYRCIQRHCSFWDEFSRSLFILFFFSSFFSNVISRFYLCPPFFSTDTAFTGAKYWLFIFLTVKRWTTVNTIFKWLNNLWRSAWWSAALLQWIYSLSCIWNGLTIRKSHYKETGPL